DPPLQQAAALEQLHVERPVLLAVRGRFRQRLAQREQFASHALEFAAQELDLAHTSLLLIRTPTSRAFSRSRRGARGTPRSSAPRLFSSISIERCEGFAAFGAVVVARCSRLYRTAKPLWSHHSSLSRSARRLRNTKTAPLRGSPPISARTASA